jgi:hypothetical protein
MKTCGIPSVGEVRSVDAVGVGISGVSVMAVTAGRTVSVAAAGNMVLVAVGGTCVEVDSTTGAWGPVQALRRKSRMKVVMSGFMDQLYGVHELAPGLKRQAA